MVTLRCWTALQKTLGKLNNVSTGTLWNFRKTNTNSHSWEGKIPCNSTKWAVASWAAALQEGTWASWWAASSTWALCALATAPAAQTGPEQVSPPSQHLSDHTDPVPRTRQTGASSGKSHHDSQGSEHFPMRRGWGNQAHSAWRKKDFSMMIVQCKLLNTKPSSSQWSMDGGWERTGMSRNMENSDWAQGKQFFTLRHK